MESMTWVAERPLQIDTQSFHPGEQSSPFKAQAGCGSIETADTSLGFFQGSHNPVLFVDVARSGKG
jgi:hypothetical protein